MSVFRIRDKNQKSSSKIFSSFLLGLQCDPGPLDTTPALFILPPLPVPRKMKRDSGVLSASNSLTKGAIKALTLQPEGVAQGCNLPSSFVLRRAAPEEFQSGSPGFLFPQPDPALTPAPRAYFLSVLPPL